MKIKLFLLMIIMGFLYSFTMENQNDTNEILVISEMDYGRIPFVELCRDEDGNITSIGNYCITTYEGICIPNACDGSMPEW